MLQAEKFKAAGNFETLMLMDHLSAQKTPELLAIFKHCRTSAAFGPRNQTHAWQPIDRGHLGPPELPFHQAPSPILLIDLSELRFHQAPSPILPCEVDVYFNKCAWATRDFTVEWAKKTWMTFLRSQAQEMT